MNKWMIGATMGVMAGIALMMSPMGKTLRQDVQKGMAKAKQMASKMEQMQ